MFNLKKTKNMCKVCVTIISTPKISKKDEHSYVQETRKQILSSNKTLKDEKFKVDINFVDHNGHIDYQSKKGSHIKRIVFDLGGHRDEEKIINNVKKGLAKVNKEENPLLIRVGSGENLHGCKSVSSFKSVCD